MRITLTNSAAGVRTLAASIALVVLAACSDASAGSPRFKPLASGDSLPAFSAHTMDGTPATLAAFRGEVVLLNIWATYCVPCRREMPALDSLARDYAGRGVRVVGVSVDAGGKDDAVREFTAAHDIGFTIWRDQESTITRALRTRGIPETFLLDREGRIARHWIGGVDTPAAGLRAAVDRVLDTAE